MSPTLAGIHHLKFAVSDLGASEAFYSAALDAERLRQADHVDADGRLYAVIMQVPHLGALLELRLNAAAARRQAGFDPVTIAVPDRAELEAWMRKLDGLGIAHSGCLTGIQAWLTVFADPDHRRLRLYTLEQHGPDLPPTADDPWLSEEAAPAPRSPGAS